MDGIFGHSAPIVGPGTVSFVMEIAGQQIRCSISIDALELYFWAAKGSDEAHLLRAFDNGKARIAAVAERKWRRLRNDAIALGAADFKL
ncbi:DUF1488 family protein [Paraburkholderia sp. BCC1884]|uniref:DUF1488 family protein n=1 Tax=Paraburkholderia sp. BCC1884 TaxID=2562668 RepID=UPI0011839463|nr:DUF1488 family protein [Paraburkholderia sp. BCC1884]